MAKKGFKDVKGANPYGGMWSGENEPQAQEEVRAEPVSVPEPEPAQERPGAVQLEEPTKRGRGRPKMEQTRKRTHFNLLLEPETMEALIKAMARIQLETGKRLTVTGLITQIINDFIAAQGGADGARKE